MNSKSLQLKQSNEIKFAKRSAETLTMFWDVASGYIKKNNYKIKIA